MARLSEQTRGVWALVRAQHGVVSRLQLEALGLTRGAIEHRIACGRLHPVMRGVYAVGRPDLTRRGRWMAAVLAYETQDGVPTTAEMTADEPRAALSHASAAALWGIDSERDRQVEVSVRAASAHPRSGVRLHRRPTLPAGDIERRDGIPLTCIARTLLDLAARLAPGDVERLINEADKLDLIDPESLRASLAAYTGEPGVGRLRRILDRRTFRLTDSKLEQWFLPIARDAGLSPPLTRRRVNGFRVDFFWPDLRLVVETDGLRYHRTPAQQARDHLRDQAHLATGFTPLRFTHAQIRFEPDHVRKTLSAVAGHLEITDSRADNGEGGIRTHEAG